MRRLFASSVTAVALTVTHAALADDAPAAVSRASSVVAKPEPAAPAHVTAAKEPESPLALRASTPLVLASEPASTPWYYKAAFGAALLAAGGIVWKRRRMLTPKLGKTGPMRVVAKTTMGLRGELALVEVGGMRLLVGITPSSMQTLAILPDDFALEGVATGREAAPASAPEEATCRSAADDITDRPELSARARALFASLDIGPQVAAPMAGPSAFSASRYTGERDRDEAPESAPAPITRTREADHARNDDRRRRAPAREMALEGQARGLALALRKGR